MRKSIFCVLIVPFLTGCYATLTNKREVTATDIPHMPFVQARKNFLSYLNKGHILGSNCYLGVGPGEILSARLGEINEDFFSINYGQYETIFSDKPKSYTAKCLYANMNSALEIREYKGDSCPNLVPICDGLGVTFKNKEDAEGFARALLVLKKRYEEGPTQEEKGGISKEEVASIVQSAVAAAKNNENNAPEPNIKSDVDTPFRSLTPNPNNYAIVIGINKYMALPSAKYAEHDAEAVRNQLISLGFPSRNVIYLSGDKAGYKSIEKFIEKWLPNNVDENSRVFFYFAGHGAPDPRKGDAYILPYDGDPSFLENTGYPVSRLYAKLNELKAKEVYVAMDACFSGAGGRSQLAQGARPLVVTTNEESPTGKITVFAAASGDQITSVLEEQGHGAFTYYFLKGLTGDAKNQDGSITVESLYKYVKPKVQDEARRQNRDQSPILRTINEKNSIVKLN